MGQTTSSALPPAKKVPVGHSSSAANVSGPQVSAPERRWKPEEVRVDTRDQVVGGDCEFGTTRSRGEEVLDAALRKAKMQAAVPPVEDRIAQSMPRKDWRLPTRSFKRQFRRNPIANRRSPRSRFGHDEGGSPSADSSRRRRLKARLAQLEPIDGFRVA